MELFISNRTMSKRHYRYSATVNGQRRTTTFWADPEAWGHESITEDNGMITPAELNLATADLIVDNERPAYEMFYDGATDADYDAERTAAVLEVYGWTIVEAD